MRSNINARKLVFSMMSVAFLLFAAMIVYTVAEAALGFTEAKKLTQASPTLGGPGWFGYDVAIDGDTAVGIAREPWRTTAPQGSTSIFERNLGGPDNWGERVKLSLPGFRGSGVCGD